MAHLLFQKLYLAPCASRSNIACLVTSKSSKSLLLLRNAPWFLQNVYSIHTTKLKQFSTSLSMVNSTCIFIRLSPTKSIDSIPTKHNVRFDDKWANWNARHKDNCFSSFVEIRSPTHCTKPIGAIAIVSASKWSTATTFSRIGEIQQLILGRSPLPRRSLHHIY